MIYIVKTPKNRKYYVSFTRQYIYINKKLCWNEKYLYQNVNIVKYFTFIRQNGEIVEDMVTQQTLFIQCVYIFNVSKHYN